MDTEKSDAFYEKLKTQLSDTAIWPSEYLYKFIVPSDGEKIEDIHTIFDGMGAVISTKESSKGTYSSISVNVKMKNPDAVVAIYKEVGEKIDGVISL